MHVYYVKDKDFINKDFVKNKAYRVYVLYILDKSLYKYKIMCGLPRACLCKLATRCVTAKFGPFSRVTTAI